MKIVKRIIVGAVALIAFAALLSISAAAFIPNEKAEAMLRRYLEENASVGYSAEGFGRRVFPPGVTLKGASIRRLGRGDAVLLLDTVTASVSPLNLLMGRVALNIEAKTAGGAVSSTILSKGAATAVDASFADIDAALIPFFKSSGAAVTGKYSGDAALVFRKEDACADGTVVMNAADIDVNAFGFAGASLLIKGRMKAALNAGIKDCRVHLSALTLSNKDISIKVDGDITLSAGFRDVTAGVMDLTLEMIPSRDMADGNLALIFLSRYRKSSNYYSMHIRGRKGSLDVTP